MDLDALLLLHFRFQTSLSSNVFFLSDASRRVTAHPYFVTVFVMLRSENSRLTVKQQHFLESRKLVNSSAFLVKHADSELVKTLTAEQLTSGYRDALPIESKGLDERHLQLAAH